MRKQYYFQPSAQGLPERPLIAATRNSTRSHSRQSADGEGSRRPALPEARPATRQQIVEHALAAAPARTAPSLHIDRQRTGTRIASRSSAGRGLVRYRYSSMMSLPARRAMPQANKPLMLPHKRDN